MDYIHEIIKNTRIEKDKLTAFWDLVLKINKETGLTENTLRELKTKISSRIAECDITIRDHQKIINK